MAEAATSQVWRERGRTAAITAGSIVLALLAGAVLMVVSDPDVITQYAYLFTAPALPLGATWAKVSNAYGALLLGAIGSPNALAETAWQAAPLICAGLGVGLGFRAGLFNIGAPRRRSVRRHWSVRSAVMITAGIGCAKCSRRCLTTAQPTTPWSR